MLVLLAAVTVMCYIMKMIFHAEHSISVQHAISDNPLFTKQCEHFTYHTGFDPLDSMTSLQQTMSIHQQTGCLSSSLCQAYLL